MQNITHKPNTKTRQTIKLSVKIQASDIIELQEGSFNKWILEIESSELFRKLMYPGNEEHSIIKYERWYNTKFYNNILELNESYFLDKTNIDIESLLAESHEIIKLINKIGEHRFKQFFLYNSEQVSVNEISEKCAITVQEINKIIEFINRIMIKNEFYQSAHINEQPEYRYYAKLAEFTVGNRTGEILINYYSPGLIKGKYLINSERLESFKKKSTFSKTELKQLNVLINNLKLINLRKSSIYQLLDILARKQAGYIKSGNLLDLIPFIQKEAAAQIGISEGRISRVINNRSVVLPNGEEKPISSLLPSNRDMLKICLQEIIDTEPALTDSAISGILDNKYHLKSSCRIVARCRAELSIKSYLSREKSGR